MPGSAGSSTTAPAPAAALPLTSRGPGDVLFRRADAGPVTADRFLRDVAGLAARLPDRRHALNLCADRYGFLVAFAAALVRGQVSLLSSDRSARGLARIAERYPDAYTLGDEATPPGGIAGVEHAAVAPLQGSPGPAPVDVPLVPADRTAAIVFTSGSTGDPVPNPKPWAALVACSEAAAERFGLDDPAAPASIVGTVPPQHMYGFETTVLLPLHAAASSYAGSTFFPRDVADALARVPGPRTLVTTPLQIRALLAAGEPLPPIAQVISATAPLPAELAAEAEAAWGGTRVLEIFGATEVGSIASRRTISGDAWRPYRTVRLSPADGDGAAAAEVAHLPGPVILADRVELLDGGAAFRLLGRLQDVVKLAGKRASLAGLGAILRGIEGVEDGAFFAPDDLDSNPRARLSAVAVAPGLSADEVAAALRARVEAPFLPRRVVLVESLPRNEVGKLPRAALAELLRRAGTNPTGRRPRPAA